MGEWGGPGPTDNVEEPHWRVRLLLEATAQLSPSSLICTGNGQTSQLS